MKNNPSHSPLSPSIIGVGYALIATVLLSFKGILIKLAYAEHVSVMDLIYYRLVFTIPFLWMYAYYKKGRQLWRLANKQNLLHCALAGFLGYYLATLSDLYSLKTIEVNVNRIILYTYPMYVLVWNAILEKKLPPLVYLIAFILVQVGLYFTLGGMEASIFQQNKAGSLFALVAAISYSFYIIINQQVGKRMGSILFTTYAISFSFLFINFHYWFQFEAHSSTWAISSKGWLFITLISFFCTFFPLLLISEGINKIGAARLSFLSLSGPILTATFAYFILGEVFTLQQWIGASMVILVLVGLEISKHRNSYSAPSNRAHAKDKLKKFHWPNDSPN